MEAFNKIIKAQFTNYEEYRIHSFILIVIQHLIPFYSKNDKDFLFYRIPHKKTVAIARQLETLQFSMKGFVECSFKGHSHTHTINFHLKSCTCRWFQAFAVCAHLVSACDFYNYELKGYTKPLVFVYKKRRGLPAAALTFSEKAFASNPMPVIQPINREDHRSDMYLIDSNNLPALPTINDGVVSVESVENVVNVENEIPAKTKRAYNKKKKDTTDLPTTTVLPTTTDLPVTTRILRNRANTSTKVDKVKRLKKNTPVAPAKPPVEVQKRRGRPPKNTPALSVQ